MQRLSLWVVNNNGYKDVAHIFDSGLECNTSSCIFSFSIKHFLSSLFSLYGKALVIELCMTHAMFKGVVVSHCFTFFNFHSWNTYLKGLIASMHHFYDVWADSKTLLSITKYPYDIGNTINMKRKHDKIW